MGLEIKREYKEDSAIKCDILFKKPNICWALVLVRAPGFEPGTSRLRKGRKIILMFSL